MDSRSHTFRPRQRALEAEGHAHRRATGDKRIQSVPTPDVDYEADPEADDSRECHTSISGWPRPSKPNEQVMDTVLDALEEPKVLQYKDPDYEWTFKGEDHFGI